MKIALVSPFYSVGGAESYSLNLAKALSQSKHSITLFVNSGEPKAGTSEFDEKLEISYLKSEVLPVDPGNPISLSLIRALTTEKFDIIHAHQMYSFFNIFSSLIGWTKRVPTVLTDHGGGWRLAALPQICANVPSAFAAVSEFSLQRMLHFAPKKRNRSRVVYGGVNTKVFHLSPKNNDLREQLNLADNPVVLVLGRVLPHKGIEVVIKALHLMPKNTRLLIVGQILDREYFRYLEELVNKDIDGRVTFVGEVKSQELPDYYNLCDVYVQPSLYFDYNGRYYRVSELLGLAKFEAMACGKPVLVSKVGGLPEKIVNGENGYIFEPGNEKELAQYVTDLLTDEPLRKKIGAKALTTIQKELTWNKIASSVLEFYNDLGSS
jgi:glycosyltransferase involved in cell wall biosynthesis